MDDKIHVKKDAGICPICKKRNHTFAPDVPGDVCDKCQDELLEKSSVILCNTCNHIAGFIEQGQSKDGFDFKLGEIYHVDHCKKCMPGVTDFKIVEVEAFMKAHHKKVNTGIFTGIKSSTRKEK
jgi:hypothetical protein